MNTGSHHGGGRRLRLWLIGAIALAALHTAGCAATAPAPKSQKPPAPSAQSPQTEVYRSDFYVVHRLRKDDTPELLARTYLDDPAKTWIIEEANPDTPFVAGQMIVIPLRDRARGGLRADGYQIVPVLCYHRFAEGCDSRLCMPASAFRAQLEYLKQNGYRTIGPADLEGFLKFRNALPKKAVMISIDDGYRSGYELAYPLLMHYGFKATFFVYTDFIESAPGALTWQMLREMMANGFDVGSHSLSHCDLTKQGKDETDGAFERRIEREIDESKKRIDAELGADTIALAYPYGEFNPKVLETAARAGYRLAFGTRRGGNAFFTDPLALDRDQILSQDMGEFTARLKTLEALPIE